MSSLKIHGIGDKVIQRLTHQKWMVHVDFLNKELFVQAIEMGFYPGHWEEENNNKVLIKGVWYKEYKE